MNSQEQGLTVGELTIAIGALIIASLIWTTIVKKEEDRSTSYILNYSSLSLSKTIQSIPITTKEATS